jgi:hypothetical protein
MDKDTLHKEIDLIQAVITRMAGNSFMLKGWLISLIAVVMAISKDSILSTNPDFLLFILCIPTVMFWYLDAFFLHREKCYRKLYEWVITNRMTSDEHLYSLNFVRFKKDVKPVFFIMFSQTLLPFYGVLFSILLVLLFVL